MQALVLKAYNQFSLEQVPSPTPGPGEVQVSVQACGICGSDVHGMDGSTGRRRPPIIMGHEAAGIISSVGAGVSAWHVGDRVTFDSTIYCGNCSYCRRGEINLCDNRRVLGVSCEDYRQHGAFAEFVVVPERILYRLPDAVTFEQAAMVEPYSIALHAIRRAQPELDDVVVVIGAGMIGLALVQALRHSGCGRIISVDVADERLEMARAFGATDTVNPRSVNAADEIARLAPGGGALSYEAVGATATVDLALRVVRKGGRIVLVGNVSPSIDFPLQVAVTRELTIFGSCASCGEYPAVLNMLARGELDPRKLISAVSPLKDGPGWFNRLHAKEPGLLKVILTPSN